MGPSRSVTLAVGLTSSASVARASRYRGSQARREAGAIGNANWRSMFEIYPSTIRMGGLCFNLVLRTVLLALTWVCLLSAGLVFNWVANWMLELAGAHSSVKSVSSAIVLVLVMTLMGAAAVTSLFDIFALARAALRDPSESDRAENDRGGS